MANENKQACFERYNLDDEYGAGLGNTSGPVTGIRCWFRGYVTWPLKRKKHVSSDSIWTIWSWVREHVTWSTKNKRAGAGYSFLDDWRWVRAERTFNRGSLVGEALLAGS
jgi:hypothetical protein